MVELHSDDVTEDRLLGGLVRLRQARSGHRAGTDAVLLAGLCGARPGDHVVDLGSASGAVGLMIAARLPATRVTLVEREPDQVALARENVALNGFAERVAVVERDVFVGAIGNSLPPHAEVPAGGRPRSTHLRRASFEAPLCGAPQDEEVGSSRPGSQDEEGGSWPPEPADLVVTNPPFFDHAGGIRVSPDEGRRKAHVMEGGDLEGWLAAAARLLKPRGRLALIHRADALGACLAALPPAFGAPEVLPIHPRQDRNASRILIHARKGGRSPLVILPALVLHEADGRFTPQAARLHDPERGPPDL